MKNIILISGKARSGKDTVARILESKLSNTLITPLADYVKFVCQKYFGWNGIKDKNGREILQKIGTDIIRKENPDFWTIIISELHFALRNEFDYFIVSDNRFPNEIEQEKIIFGNKVITLKIERPNYKSILTEEQKNHISEIALDDFEFDYIIINDGTIEDLEKKVEIFIERFIKDD